MNSGDATVSDAACSGDFLRRSTLTGDWGGARNDLAAKGVTFDIRVTQITQGVGGGGKSGEPALLAAGYGRMPTSSWSFPRCAAPYSLPAMQMSHRAAGAVGLLAAFSVTALFACGNAVEQVVDAVRDGWPATSASGSPNS